MVCQTHRQDMVWAHNESSIRENNVVEALECVIRNHPSCKISDMAEGMLATIRSKVLAAEQLNKYLKTQSIFLLVLLDKWHGEIAKQVKNVLRGI